MRSLVCRLLVTGLALLAGGALAGCSGAPGMAFADGTTRPAASAATTAVSAPQALASSSASPASPAPSPTLTGDLVVAGAPKGVLAKGGVLVDAGTGQVLWNRGMNAERPMASITKVMTAYLVISAGNIDRKVAIPKGVLDYVAKYGASSDSLKPGEVVTVRQLLYGLLLESGADAAYTLAAAYGPGLNAFVAQMNATAAQLGMAHTHFTSPDGLPYPTETATYSTPADLVTLGEAAMRSSLFRAIVDQRFVNLAKGQGHEAHWWGNSNGLIGSYPGAVGIKTGYTDVALHCLLFEAVRDGRTLIGVVLGSPATGPWAGAQDAARVLDWGFALKKAKQAGAFMASRKQAKLDRRAQIEAMRTRERARARKFRIAWLGGGGVVVIAVIVAIVLVVTSSSGPKVSASAQVMPPAVSGQAIVQPPATTVPNDTGVTGVVAYVTTGWPASSKNGPAAKALGHDHVPGLVTYSVTPPVGGDHNATWMNCGVYNQPVPNERAVHNLEHGAIWITYQPSLPAAQLSQLYALFARQTVLTSPAGSSSRYLDITPFPGLPSPIVVTSWGFQLKLASATDPRLQQFINKFRFSQKYTPEYGGPCTGGVGTPLKS